jgi:hypothetical protein
VHALVWKVGWATANTLQHALPCKARGRFVQLSVREGVAIDVIPAFLAAVIRAGDTIIRIEYSLH